MGQRSQFERASIVVVRAIRISAVVGLFACNLPADVIVLSNRAGIQVPLRFAPTTGQQQQFILAPDDTMPMFVDGRANLFFASRGTPKQYALDANCVYYFGRGLNGAIDLQKIGL